jgi:hypothetical protein
MKFKKPLVSFAWVAAIVISVFVIPRLMGLDSAEGGLYRGLQGDLNDRLVSAAKIFAITKVIAGTLSFLQNLQIDVGMVVAGVSITPLSVLEPISYTLNIISNLFLFAMGAIILEKVLMVAGSWLALRLLFPLAFILAGTSEWLKGEWRERIRKAALYAGIASFVVWLAIPLSIGFANLLDAYFLDELTQNAAQSLEDRSQRITLAEKELSNPEVFSAPDNNSSGWLGKTLDKINISRIAKKINDAALGVADTAKAAVEDMMKAFTSFLVTTIIVPIFTILLLWLFLKKILLP